MGFFQILSKVVGNFEKNTTGVIFVVGNFEKITMVPMEKVQKVVIFDDYF